MKIAIIDTLGLYYDGNTLDKQGLGGSESAVILISKELSKIGFQVDVYNNCNDGKNSSSGIYDGVTYTDHKSHRFNSVQHNYDIVISSRSISPFTENNQYYKLTKAAKHRVLWMHDTFCQGDEHIETMITNGMIHEIFTLSDFHTSYVTNSSHGPHRMFEVLKPYIWQTRNGAVKHMDDIDLSLKDKNHFVYNASATKGLMPLLKNIWPHIKKQIPAAKLTCIGGYYRFKENSPPDAQEKTVIELMNDSTIKSMDVTFTGVIDQKQIANILANANFMLYPPEFPETFGISSLESLLYKTPIITSNFGALEETAIDLACYKIDYPAVPNSLFPHIDANIQTQKYIDTVIKAYNDTYLHQQKQNYCSVVDDVAGWDTVALQWKQHFFFKLNKPFPVKEYRKVSYINKKVARVFGRKFTNEEQLKEYTSYNPQKRIVIISPFYNAEKYIENHIRSVAQQNYNNYLHILINDASTDNSRQIAEKTIKELFSENPYYYVMNNNENNVGAIANQLSVIEEYVCDDDIVIFLDGDDWLVNNNSIFHYYNDLYNSGYDFTYGSMWSLADNIPLIAQDYPNNVKQNKTFRNHKFNWGIPYTHLRTVLGKLTKDLNKDSYKVDGKWMKAGADNPLFYELIERASKPLAVKEIMVNYNDVNPLNDYKINGEEQNKNANIPSTKPSNILMNKKILIAVPTNKNVETETMKSIYDLIIPNGYNTELQFFFGYRIDQIRNLISEWAKNYDYLLAVDSDMVLPNDTLIKMLAADKDIISGLYIQRKPDVHILEVYKSTSNGGCVNIPYNEIQGKGLVPIAACGFGCVLIKGDVFRKMEYPHFVYTSAIDHAYTISEDVYFCNKARSLGFQLFADTSIICDHIGNTKFLVNSPIKTEEKTHVQKIAELDLLPKPHADYLKQMSINPNVIYDIGASLLHWTNKAKEAWPNAEYFLADATETTKEFLEKSGYKYYHGVLSDEDGKIVTFYEDEQNPGGNSYYKENTKFYTEAHGKSRISLTLDTVTAKLPKPDLIKLDVQGAELDILRGGLKCLQNAKDIILEAQHVEYNIGAPRVEEVIKFMEENGFKLISKFCSTDVDADYHFKRI